MSKKVFNFNNAQDIDEIRCLILEDDICNTDVPEDDIEESFDESETEDNLETRSSDSDSDEIDLEEVEQEDSNDNSYTAPDGTKWRKKSWRVSQTPARSTLKLPGVESQSAKQATSEADCWRLFFDSRIIHLLVENTNIYINKIRENFFRARDCRETDRLEMEAFLGLLYLAAVFRGGHQSLSVFWSTDGLGIDIFRISMSEKRFRFLIRCVRFDNTAIRSQRKETDNFAAVRELFEYFVENCKKCFHLGQNVTVDEMLPDIRG